MVDKESLQEDLRALAQHGIEPARDEFAQEIKHRIPHRLIPHRMDTVSIIVDLRISRVGAVAAIIVAVVLAWSFFGGREGIGTSVFQDSKLFLKYKLGGEKICSSLSPDGLMGLRDNLLAQGREVVCYSENLDSGDRFAILMHWRISEDEYCVVMGDLSATKVSARTLILLQAYMLQSRSK